MSKKAKSKKNKKVSRLHDVLEMHYEGYRYKKGFSEHDTVRHSIFNRKLRSFLVDCNNKSFIPSKSFVEKEILKIKDEVDYEISMKGIDLNSFDINRIDENIENMDFQTSISTDEKSSIFNRVITYRVFGIIPLSRLTDSDIEFLSSAFKGIGKIHKEESAFLVDLMRVRASKVIDEDRKDLISDMLLRKTRETFRVYAKSKGFKTSFKYSYLRKIKDFFLNGDI